MQCDKRNSENAVCVGGVLRIADLLQYVPMLYGLAIGVHPEDVNAGNPTVLQVVVEEINEMDVCQT